MPDMHRQDRTVKRNTSFGWPKGTVRAIITLTLIILTAVNGFILMFHSKDMSPDMLKVAHGVFTAFVSAMSLMLGSYVSKK